MIVLIHSMYSTVHTIVLQAPAVLRSSTTSTKYSGVALLSKDPILSIDEHANKNERNHNGEPILENIFVIR